MKKVILLFTSMLTSICILVSFSTKKKTNSLVTQPTAGIITCSPPAAPTLITAAAFQAKYMYSTVMVRKNVDALSTTEINAIKNGITNMKALPYTDPTSWQYQAAIHGTAMTDNLTSWNSCHKAGQAFFFLAWHRMYVYFFERILRAKSGRSTPTLPYWNYQINPVLHPAYRNNSAGNPLYDASRNPAINEGGALPSSIMTAFSNAFAFIPYYDFQNGLNGPHGSVHTTINGNMANVLTAAKDPVFWLHHSNIDRMWEEWLRKCNGRGNPIDSAWLNNTYTFFDELGNAVSMKGSQVVKISTQLNYKYDALSSTKTCPSAKMMSIASKQVLIRKAAPVILKGQTERANFVQEESDQLESFIKTNKRTNFNFNSYSSPEKLVLNFDGIKIDKMPLGVVEVYLNLPAGATPSADSKYFAGLLDLFSAQHQLIHALRAMEGKDDIELDATKVAQALGLTLADLRKAEVSLFVRGSTLRGKEVKTEAAVRIQHLEFSISKFKN
jgi:Common central domain of tyrosinase/Polyphenol oxidase middle domain